MATVILNILQKILERLTDEFASAKAGEVRL